MESGWVVYSPGNGYSFSFPRLIRGQATLLEIVFVGQCEVFDFVYAFFPWPQSSYVRKRGVNSLKNVDFSVACPLNSMSYLRVNIERY